MFGLFFPRADQRCLWLKSFWVAWSMSSGENLHKLSFFNHNVSPFMFSFCPYIWPIPLFCSDIDPSQFIPSEPVSIIHDCSLWASVLMTLSSVVIPVLWSHRHAGQLCLQNRMRARRRGSSAKSSSSSLVTWVLLHHEPADLHSSAWFRVSHVCAVMVLNPSHAGHGSEPDGADEHPQQNHLKT